MEEDQGKYSVAGIFTLLLKLDALSVVCVFLVLSIIIMISVRVQFEVHYANQALQEGAARSISITSVTRYNDPKAAATPENRITSSTAVAEMGRTFIDKNGRVISENRIVNGSDLYVSDSLGSLAVSGERVTTPTFDFLGGNPATQRIEAVANQGTMNTYGKQISCRLVAVKKTGLTTIIAAPQIIDPNTIPDNEKKNYTIRELCEISQNPIAVIWDVVGNASTADVLNVVGNGASLAFAGLAVKKIFF